MFAAIFYEPPILHALLKKKPKFRNFIWEIVPKKGEGGPAQSQFSCSQIAEQEYSIFSVTRRSRSDESHLLTYSLSVSIDFTDVTLVSDDTYGRLY